MTVAVVVGTTIQVILAVLHVCTVVLITGVPLVWSWLIILLEYFNVDHHNETNQVASLSPSPSPSVPVPVPIEDDKQDTTQSAEHEQPEEAPSLPKPSPPSSSSPSSSSSSYQHYIDVGEAALNELWEYVQDIHNSNNNNNSSTTNEWELDRTCGHGDELIEVFKRASQHQPSRKVFMTRALINAKPENLHNLFKSYNTTPEWNPQVRDYRMLQEINDRICITDLIAAPAAGGAVSSRDFVDVRALRLVDGQHWLLGGASVQYSSCPPHKNVIRAHSACGGWICLAIPERGPNWTYFYYVMDADLKGWLPRSLIDMTIGGIQVEFVQLLRKMSL